MVLVRSTGPSRPACPRGQSFTSKSLFLRHQLINSAEEMQLVVTPPSMFGTAGKRPNRIDTAEFTLHTEKRAVERKVAAAHTYQGHYRRQSDESADVQPESTTNETRKQAGKIGRCSSALSSSTAAHAVASHEAEAEERPTAQPSRDVPMRRASSFGAVPVGLRISPSESPIKAIVTSKNIAEWRKRCHASRRRVSPH